MPFKKKDMRERGVGVGGGGWRETLQEMDGRSSSVIVGIFWRFVFSLLFAVFGSKREKQCCFLWQGLATGLADFDDTHTFPGWQFIYHDAHVCMINTLSAAALCVKKQTNERTKTAK